MKRIAYLGIDVGGSAAKAGVVDGNGHLPAFARSWYKPHLSEEGHVEIPVDTIYNAARGAASSAIRASGATIAALSFATQGETFVSLFERQGACHIRLHVETQELPHGRKQATCPIKNGNGCGKGADKVGCVLNQEVSLAQGFLDQAEFAILEVPQPTSVLRVSSGIHFAFAYFRHPVGKREGMSPIGLI